MSNNIENIKYSKKSRAKKQYQCSQCSRTAEQDKIYMIDDELVCSICLYGNAKPFKIYPIGVVSNNLRRAKIGFGTLGKKEISCIELFDSQKPFLYKIEDETQITIVYYLHESKNVRSVFNRGLDSKKVGVFASRTPDRLSKIAIQDVRLVKIEGTKLYVEGLDAINGSPVLDIKMSWLSTNI